MRESSDPISPSTTGVLTRSAMPQMPASSIRGVRYNYRRDCQGFLAHTIGIPPSQPKPHERKENGYLYLMLDGVYFTQIDGLAPDVAEPMSLTYHPPGESGTGAVGPEGVRMFGVLMPAAVLHEAAEAGLAPCGWRDIRNPELGRLACRMLGEMLRPDQTAELLVHEVACAIVARAASDREHAERREPRWLKGVRAALHDAPDQGHALSDLAARAGVHPVHLSATFRRFHGMPLGEYLRALRLREACRRIMTTDEPLGEIAQGAGYYDQPHFVRSFRREVGVTPGALRASRRLF